MDNCLYCEKPLIHVDGRRKKQFCNNTCRSKYWYKNRIKDAPKVVDLNTQTNQIKPKEQPKTNYSINTGIPPMPTRMDGEDSIDFATRKNEWKKLYNP